MANQKRYAADVLAELRRSKLEGYDGERSVNLLTARERLNAMPEPAQLYYGGVMADMLNKFSIRGFGVVTAFELMLALGTLLAREVPDGR